jgi:hypothetical protein
MMGDSSTWQLSRLGRFMPGAGLGPVWFAWQHGMVALTCTLANSEQDGCMKGRPAFDLPDGEQHGRRCSPDAPPADA